MRVGVGGAGVLALTVLAAASGRAQTPPASLSPPASIQQPPLGFVPPFEILRTVRASGFDPLAPPLREGGVYVLRVTDFRGILMRVVVDARTGVIHEVTRIVPNPTSSEEVEMVPQGYGPPPDATMPVDDGPDSIMGNEPPLPPAPDRLSTGSLPPPRANPAVAPAAPAAASFPPLPRSRPAEFAARRPDAVATPPQSPVAPAANTGAKIGPASPAAPSVAPAAAAPTKPDPASSVAAAAKPPPAPDLPFNN